MDRKKALIGAIATVAIVFGSWMVLRSLDSNGPTRQRLESVMHNLPTEDLIYRRQFMHTQIEQAKVGGTGPRPDLLASAESSLAELDAILRERGVDPEAIGNSKPGAGMEIRDERP